MITAVLGGCIPTAVCEDHLYYLFRKNGSAKSEKKFHNTRRRRDSSLPIVHKKHKKEEATAVDEPSMKTAYSMDNYMPDKAAGEDDASTEVNRKWLKEPYVSRKKNPALIKKKERHSDGSHLL